MASSMAPAMAVMSALFLAMVLSLATSAQAGSHLRPPQMKIRGFSDAGNGCGGGGGEVAYSHNTLTIIRGGMFTDSTGHRRKTCLFSFSLDYTTGWRFTIEKVTVSFFAEISKGSRFGYNMGYYFSPSSGAIGISKPEGKVSRIIDGPKEDNLEFTDHFLPLVYSQCNDPNLNIRTEARFGRQTSVTNFKLTLHLIWKQC